MTTKVVSVLTLIFSIGSITTPIFKAGISTSLPDDPCAGERVVPSALFAVPENAQIADEERPRENAHNPAPERAAVADRLAAPVDDTQPEEPLPDGAAVLRRQHDEITCGEREPREHDDARSALGHIERDRARVRSHADAKADATQAKQQQREQAEHEHVDHERRQAPEKSAPSHRRGRLVSLEAFVQTVVLAIDYGSQRRGLFVADFHRRSEEFRP